MRKDFYLFRHGQTDYNKELRIQGKGIDADLNEEGIAQAEALAVRLEPLELEQIYTSPLRRAVQTAQIAANHLHIGLEIIENLHEQCMGVAEGMLKSELAEKYPDLYTDWYSGKDEMSLRCPNGESKQEVQDRMFAVIESLLESPHTKIGIASHGGAIRYLLYKFGMEPHKMPNTALYHLIYEDGKWTLLE